MHAGAAPLECSSGAWQRHRLSRVGNRQLNAALHRIAVTQLRVHPPAQALVTAALWRRDSPPALRARRG
jgi:transposase